MTNLGEPNEQRVATSLLTRIEHHVRRAGDDKGMVLGLDRSETSLLRRLLSAFIGGSLAAMVFCVPSDVLAHDFYSGACCDEKDCKPEADWPVKVTITPKGYHVEPWGETIPFEDSRVKPVPPIHDTGVFHVCQTYVWDNRQMLNRVRCIYKPNFYQ